MSLRLEYIPPVADIGSRSWVGLKLGCKYLAVDSMLKTSICDALNKIKSNPKNFQGERKLCEESVMKRIIK